MKSPIPYTYDLNTKSAQKVICVTHTDDNSVDVIQLHVVQNGALIDFSGNTIIARMVMSRTHELLSDNVVCEIDEVTKDIMIPIDRKAVSTRKGLMLVEVSVRGVLPQKLTFQFPLLVRVNGSILDDAEITPESQGTIPELLIAAAEELRRVQGFITSDDVYDILDSTLQGAQNVTPSLYVKRKGDNYALVYEDSEDVLHELFDFANLPSGTSDYTDLENKPQINGNTLSGNKTSDDLGLQKKLTAGQNITIESDGTISADGGIDDYNELINLPRVFMWKDDTGGFDAQILGRITFADLQFEGNITFTPGKPSSQEVVVRLSPAVPTNYMVTEDWWGNYDFNQLKANFAKSGTFKIPLTNVVNKPNEFNNLIGELFITHYFQPRHSSSTSFIRLVTGINSNNDIINYIQISELQSAGYGSRTYNLISASTWQEIGGSNQLISAVVNQNGTITFTNSDGTTFTTTGSSVIGPQGPAGADGHDYVLTAQDKSDIADIVLNELPTTQGVQYGNTSN